MKNSSDYYNVCPVVHYCWLRSWVRLSLSNFRPDHPAIASLKFVPKVGASLQVPTRALTSWPLPVATSVQTGPSRPSFPAPVTSPSCPPPSTSTGLRCLHLKADPLTVTSHRAQIQARNLYGINGWFSENAVLVPLVPAVVRNLWI